MSETVGLECYPVPDPGPVTSAKVPPAAPSSGTCQLGGEAAPIEDMEHLQAVTGNPNRAQGPPWSLDRDQTLNSPGNPDYDSQSPQALEANRRRDPIGGSLLGPVSEGPTGNLDPQSELELCPQHEAELSWFCYTDDRLVCSHCAIEGKCKSHLLKPLDRRAMDVRNKLVDQCEKLQLRAATIEKYLAEVLPGKNQSVASAASSARELVIQRLNYVREACDNEEQSLLEQVHAEEERAHQNILTQRAHWTDSLQKLSTIKGYLVDVLTKVDDRSLVKTEKEIFERAEEAEGILEPEESEKLMFNQKCVQSPLLHLLWAPAVLISLTDAEDIRINEKTISPSLTLSEDKKILTFISKKQKDYQDYPERFDHWPNALAINCFQSGIHTWRIDIGNSGAFKLGISYSCLERKGSGSESRLGYNASSWVFSRYDKDYSFTHDGKHQTLDLLKRPMQIGVLVDFQGGELLFYDPESCVIIHAHHTKFTAPVYPAFAVANDSITLM